VCTLFIFFSFSFSLCFLFLLSFTRIISYSFFITTSVCHSTTFFLSFSHFSLIQYFPNFYHLPLFSSSNIPFSFFTSTFIFSHFLFIRVNILSPLSSFHSLSFFFLNLSFFAFTSICVYVCLPVSYSIDITYFRPFCFTLVPFSFHLFPLFHIFNFRHFFQSFILFSSFFNKKSVRCVNNLCG